MTDSSSSLVGYVIRTISEPTRSAIGAAPLIIATTALALNSNGAADRIRVSSQAGASDSIVTVDSAGDVGLGSSLALDSSGFPVIAYSDLSNGELKLTHCNDPDCVGGDESIVTVDGSEGVGAHASLTLDGSGNPVVSYLDATNFDLKLAHCNDPYCVGGDESIVTLDSSGDVGLFTSLTLDGSGFPVVSYWDLSNSDLKLIHCNDVNCTGTNESIVTVDSNGSVGFDSSLALDGAGNPVVSYSGNGDLKLAHCNDPNCAGTDDTIVAVDGGGGYTSLVLDGSGFPVISYSNNGLMLARCNDVDCSGLDESISTIENGANIGWYTSLALDASGVPVVSYYDFTDGDLRIVRCNDASCAGAGEIIVILDSIGDVGEYSSIVLDDSGFPVISYYDRTNGDLKLAHCNDPICSLPQQSFSDVPIGHWAWQFVEAVFLAGLTAGFPDGSYRPDNPVTRAEMAVFITKGIHGSTYTPPPSDGSHPFSDISGHWAEAWIEDLYDQALTTGFPDGTYRPENQVTRAEMAVFLKLAIHGSGYTPPTPNGSHPFSDISGHWAEAWMEDLYDEGITSGYPDGTYRPENSVTRAEMAVFLVNAFSLLMS